MLKSRIYSFIIGLFLILATTVPVRADGIIVPGPPPDCIDKDCIDPILPRPISQLVIRYHHVDVRIEDQIAEVYVDQEFYNPNDWAVEGFYIFPLPLYSAVSEFALWVDGEPVKGEVLDAQKARQVYEEAVHQLQDPALLEYLDHGAIKASVYPIPPDGSQRIELKYYQVLNSEKELVDFSYPLNTEKFSNLPLEEVKITVDIQSSQPLRAVYSLSHEVQVVMDGEKRARVNYEEENVLPDKDFELFYSTGQGEGVHLLSYFDTDGGTEEEAGYFTLFIAPPSMENIDPVAKDILFVLDCSGSMEGEKFRQARAALIYVLKQLNPDDRFYLTAFNDTIQFFSNNLMPAAVVEDAVRWVETLSPGGSTDINRALLETVTITRMERPTYLMFLTDGLPTEGEINTKKILDNFYRATPDSLRAFVFGVGYDVDTFLLDSLSEEHHGISTYVKPGASLEEVISEFYNKISSPVLTDIAVTFSETAVFDVYPKTLPDLFAGTQLIVLGRYREGSGSSITLSGVVNGKRQEIVFEELLFDDGRQNTDDVRNSIPRLWATRKIGYLLKEIRLKGPNQELVDQIIQLSIRYGIVTPYTSFLVTEPDPLGHENQTRLSQEAFEKFEAASDLPSYGMDAFERAAGEGQLAGASVAAPLPEDLSQRVKIVGDRAFLLEEGVWTDTLFDPESMKTREVAYLSKEYFALAESSPRVAAWLALGKSVIFVKGNIAYQIIAEDDYVSWVPKQAELAGQEMEPTREELVRTPSILDVSQQEERTEPETLYPAAEIERKVNLSVQIVAGIVILAVILTIISIKNLFNRI